jgi:gluconate kinase
MPASLLKSQLEVLEPPAADEQALLVDGNAPTAIQVREAVAAVQAQLPALGIKAKT